MSGRWRRLRRPMSTPCRRARRSDPSPRARSESGGQDRHNVSSGSPRAFRRAPPPQPGERRRCTPTPPAAPWWRAPAPILRARDHPRRRGRPGRRRSAPCRGPYPIAAAVSSRERARPRRSHSVRAATQPAERKAAVRRARARGRLRLQKPAAVRRRRGAAPRERREFRWHAALAENEGSLAFPPQPAIVAWPCPPPRHTRLPHMIPPDVHLQIGSLLFEGLDQIDLTGPFAVLSRIPNSTYRVFGKTSAPVRDLHGLGLVPDATMTQ